ncbi:hypothetical protein H257_09311 [Aphanomyces astaci]|uniref:DDE Tnp4 domain-containing protein n=1 Tax=Aphanomyces astaci TaxID=112090 RepID=W4GD30_APHAT|nr:hypothetical protein H257_09311 [Aphanomyces astaci]ETV76873.1 hypothetical protein H257_09311 [Aphanomyces astaci]|eukprot:XP_009833785.1 hypothetical protein H257_09311 [Aphanomyces astaci]
MGSDLIMVLMARLARRRSLLRRMRALKLRAALKERNRVQTASLPRMQTDIAWYYMYASRDRASFIATVSLTPEAFDELLVPFAREYVDLSRRGRGGRPPRVQDKHAVLAIVLHFYTAAVEHKTLQELFGVASTTLSRLLRRGEDALSRALQCMPAARIKWPSKATQLYWASKSQEREPLVSGVFVFVDGKSLGVQEPSCADLQNAHYNGWLHSLFVTGVLCFGLDGTIIWGRHNCPGFWNDGEMSRRLQEFLADGSRVAPGIKLASDSAFPVGGLALGRIVTPLKQGNLERYQTECRLGLQTMSDCIPSLRQAAEWGMGAVPKVYRQLMLPLPFNPALRNTRLSNLFRLCNYRVRRTGI